MAGYNAGVGGYNAGAGDEQFEIWNENLYPTIPDLSMDNVPAADDEEVTLRVRVTVCVRHGPGL